MSSPSDPIVRTPHGPVQGRSEGGLARFLGIEYAAAPAGRNRFQPPQPVRLWEGVRPALAFGPTPAQGEKPDQMKLMFPEVRVPGEGCLNLNVWTPTLDPQARLPVMVWLFGGGFTNGTASSPELDGTALARSGVVCVTANFRLGAEAFLYLDDSVANVGLQDQIAVLEWVRDSIAAFGGDPNQVTLAGWSSGGSSVSCLLASPRARGLFQRAIVQSTSNIYRLTSREFATEVGREFARLLDVQPDRAALGKLTVPKLLGAMDAVSASIGNPVDPSRWGPDADSMSPWAPTMDGGVLPLDPMAWIRAGGASDVPVLCGTVKEELRSHFTPRFLDGADEETLRAAVQKFGDVDAIIDAYRQDLPRADFGDLITAITTDWYFRMPMCRFAEAQAAGGGDVWMYRMDRPRRSENDGYGACHGVDVPFIFGTAHDPSVRTRLGPDPDLAVERTLHETWVRFIQGDQPGWARYDSVDRSTALLTDEVQHVLDPDPHARQAWDALGW